MENARLGTGCLRSKIRPRPALKSLDIVVLRWPRLRSLETELLKNHGIPSAWRVDGSGTSEICLAPRREVHETGVGRLGVEGHATALPLYVPDIGDRQGAECDVLRPPEGLDQESVPCQTVDVLKKRAGGASALKNPSLTFGAEVVS